MKITILTPAHNEEDIIERCILSVKQLNIPKNVYLEHVVIADRCEDKTVEICRKHSVKVLIKDFRGECVSAITDAMIFGAKKVTCDIIGKVDADIILPDNWLEGLLPYFDKKTISVACDIRSTGKLMWLRNLNYRLFPFGRQPRGGGRLIKRSLLEKIGGFDCTKPTWDTAFDLKANKYGLISKNIPHIVAIEQRNQSLMQIITHQIASGRARRNLGISPLKTMLHAFFRGRFGVLLGYFQETLRSNKKRQNRN